MNLTYTLDDKEVVRAIEVYMALKGFKTNGAYKFSLNKDGGFAITVNVEQEDISLEKIASYAKNG
jgi:hypothetical protein